MVHVEDRKTHHSPSDLLLRRATHGRQRSSSAGSSNCATVCNGRSSGDGDALAYDLAIDCPNYGARLYARDRRRTRGILALLRPADPLRGTRVARAQPRYSTTRARKDLAAAGSAGIAATSLSCGATRFRPDLVDRSAQYLGDYPHATHGYPAQPRGSHRFATSCSRDWGDPGGAPEGGQNIRIGGGHAGLARRCCNPRLRCDPCSAPPVPLRHHPRGDPRCHLDRRMGFTVSRALTRSCRPSGSSIPRHGDIVDATVRGRYPRRALGDRDRLCDSRGAPR